MDSIQEAFIVEVQVFQSWLITTSNESVPSSYFKGLSILKVFDRVFLFLPVKSIRNLTKKLHLKLLRNIKVEFQGSQIFQFMCNADLNF